MDGTLHDIIRPWSEIINGLLPIQIEPMCKNYSESERRTMKLPD